MKKRTAGIPTTVVVLSLGSYVAWCARTFYLPPPWIDPADLPAEVAAAAPGLMETAGMMRKEEFSLERLFHYVRYPYAWRPELGVHAERKPEDMITIYANNPPIIMCFGTPSPKASDPAVGEIYFIRKAGKWEHVPAQEGMLHE